MQKLTTRMEPTLGPPPAYTDEAAPEVSIEPHAVEASSEPISLRSWIAAIILGLMFVGAAISADGPKIAHDARAVLAGIWR